LTNVISEKTEDQMNGSREQKALGVIADSVQFLN